MVFYASGLLLNQDKGRAYFTRHLWTVFTRFTLLAFGGKVFLIPELGGNKGSEDTNIRT